MLAYASVTLINIYQKWISPHKGFCCAYRCHTGGLSCSKYAKHKIKHVGLLKAILFIRQRFQMCKKAHLAMEDDKRKAVAQSRNSKSNQKKSYQEECNRCDDGLHCVGDTSLGCEAISSCWP